MRLSLLTVVSGIFLISSAGFAAGNQTFSFESKGLKVSGQLPLNLDKPISVSGFDEMNQPYALSVTTKKEKSAYRVTYQLDRNSVKIRSATVIVKAGSSGRVTDKEVDKPDSFSFETTVNE